MITPRRSRAHERNLSNLIYTYDIIYAHERVTDYDKAFKMVVNKSQKSDFC